MYGTHIEALKLGEKLKRQSKRVESEKYEDFTLTHPNGSSWGGYFSGAHR